MDALGEGIPLTRAELGARLGSSGMTLVLLADENVGTWRRTLRARTVSVEVALAPGGSTADHAAVRAAAEALAAFYDRRLDLTIRA